MALILDHINGIADDHRLENLRMVCPNCAATLPTHCAKQNRVQREPRECPGCGKSFVPLTKRQRFCQRRCWILHKRGRPQPDLRRVDRPPYTHLLREVAAIGYLATGRRYGVSDNAIRKWIRQYEKEQAAAKEPPEDLAA